MCVCVFGHVTCMNVHTIVHLIMKTGMRVKERQSGGWVGRLLV